MSTEQCLWEILVPTVRPNTDGKRFFKTKYHQIWDAKVREITGGLTVLTPVNGQWMSETGVLFRERMIPVRIAATRSQIDEIIDLTLEFYHQETVLCYMISSTVIFKSSNKVNSS